MSTSHTNNIVNKSGITKIKLCAFYLNGTCTHMKSPNKCKFAHGIDDLSIRCGYKTTECKYKKEANRPYGKFCNYLHLEENAVTEKHNNDFSESVIEIKQTKLPSGQELYKILKKYIENNDTDKAEELCTDFFKKFKCTYDDIYLKMSDAQIQDLAESAIQKLNNFY